MILRGTGTIFETRRYRHGANARRQITVGKIAPFKIEETQRYRSAQGKRISIILIEFETDGNVNHSGVLP